jgi:flagellar protein FlaE
MNTTVLESILQLLMQDLTATVGVAVLFTVGLAVSARVLWGVVAVDDPAGEPISDGGTTSFAGSETDQQSDDELEHRIDELETEVDSLSSTVKTVRNENEQISESVQDIEESTGRLLNLYKMATRGANPFASEPAESAASEPTAPTESDAVRHGSTEGEEFSKEDEIEEIDTQVADDSAADLFDSPDTEIREEHCVDSVEEVVDSGNEPDDAFQRSKQAEQQAETDSGTEESVDDQFEAAFETKTVESTEPEDEQFGTEEMIEAGGEAGPAASDGGQLLDSSTEDTTTDAPQTTASADTAAEPVFDLDAAVEPEPEPEPEPSVDSDDQSSAPESGTAQNVTTPAIGPATESPTGTSDGKPYIESLPENVSTEVMTVEWLEYLVDEVGIRGTVRALDYYETIGWLTEEAVEELDEYLAAFEDPDQEDLSIEHHLRSLDYVEELRHASED